MSSGLYGLSLAASLGPAVIVAAISVTITKSYRPQLWLGWAILIIGMGLMSTIEVNTAPPTVIGFTILVGIGAGMIFGCNWFPVLAPLDISQNAHAIALFSFCRSFAAVSNI